MAVWFLLSGGYSILAYSFTLFFYFFLAYYCFAFSFKEIISFRLFLSYMSLFDENSIMQSPASIFSSLKFLWIRTSLLRREYLLSSKISPLYSSSLPIIPSALSSPHRCILLAFRASTALVHAQPLSLSAIICISSITATLYSSFKLAASIVQLTKLEFLYYFY